MHSPPIDILATAPSPQKAGAQNAEPDGRFSELLRGPAEARAGQQPDTATAAADGTAAHALRAGTEAGIAIQPEAAVDPSEVTSSAAVALAVHAVPVIPEAITLAQPQTSRVPAGTDIAAPGIISERPSEATPEARQPSVAPQAASPQPDAGHALPPTGRTGPTVDGTQSGQPGATADLTKQAAPATPADPHGGRPALQATQPPPMMTAQAPTAEPAARGGDPTTAVEAATLPTPNRRAVPAPSAAQPQQSGATATDGRASETITKAFATVRSAAQPAVQKTDRRDISVADVLTGPDSDATTARTQPSTVAPGKTLSTAPIATPAGAQPEAVAATATKSAAPASADLPADTPQPEPVAATSQSQPARPGSIATPAPAVQVGTTHGTPAPAAEQVVLQLRRAVSEGVDRLTVQMKPATLGRVDIHMEVGFDGRVQAVISAERTETLHLLQRDARALTTALNDAGLQADSGSLSFNLRGQSGNQAGDHGHAVSDDALEPLPSAGDDAEAAIPQIILTLGAGRVDITV